MICLDYFLQLVVAVSTRGLSHRDIVLAPARILQDIVSDGDEDRSPDQADRQHEQLEACVKQAEVGEADGCRHDQQDESDRQIVGPAVRTEDNEEDHGHDEQTEAGPSSDVTQLVVEGAAGDEADERTQAGVQERHCLDPLRFDDIEGGPVAAHVRTSVQRRGHVKFRAVGRDADKILNFALPVKSAWREISSLVFEKLRDVRCDLPVDEVEADDKDQHRDTNNDDARIGFRERQEDAGEQAESGMREVQRGEGQGWKAARVCGMDPVAAPGDEEDSHDGGKVHDENAERERG